VLVEIAEDHQADYKNDQTKPYRTVFPAVFRIGGTHGAEPTICWAQTIDEYRRKFAHGSRLPGYVAGHW
jgi:hypothetical protein